MSNDYKNKLSYNTTLLIKKKRKKTIAKIELFPKQVSLVENLFP